MKYELLDHGVDHSQYFQGCGTAHTDYDECATGIGNDPREALDDCLDQIADQTSSGFVEELERLILKDFPAFNDAATIARNTVDRGEQELTELEERIEELTHQADEETDEDTADALRDEITELEERYTELEDAREMSELWYHISIRYCHAENLDALSIDPKDYDAYAADEDNPEPLRQYAAGKANAMRHRLAGNIAEAFTEEARIDRIYNNLPPFMKW